MNFEQLENYLYNITDSENRYLHNDEPIYMNNYSTTVSDRTIYQFSYKEFQDKTNDSFYIRKQSRFTPVPEHFTDVIELNYVYHGTSKHYVNKKKVLLNQGDLILIDTNASHEVAAVDYNDIVISVNISQNFFKQHFLNLPHESSSLSHFLYQAISKSQQHNQYLIFKSGKSKKLHLLFQQLLEETFEPSIYHEQIRSHYLQLILIELITSFSVEANGIIQTQQQQLTLDILGYIDKHYLETSLTCCANQFGYNSTYFSHLVKEITGSTFKKLLQEKKLEVSLIALTNSKQSIQNIALESGFTNLNQYYKIFKERFQMTPAQYREKNTQTN